MAFYPREASLDMARDPEKLRRQIKALLRERKTLPEVAAGLGVSVRTLHRYMTKLKLKRPT
jgi:hypothetical protein